jgi:hypothetical protein
MANCDTNFVRPNIFYCFLFLDSKHLAQKPWFPFSRFLAQKCDGKHVSRYTVPRHRVTALRVTHVTSSSPLGVGTF